MTFLEHLSSSCFSGGSCISHYRFFKAFCRSLLWCCLFSFGHCIVCPSSIWWRSVAFNKRPNSFDPFWKGFNRLFFSFCPFSGIVLHRVNQKFEVVFPIYGLWLTICWTFCKVLRIFSYSILLTSSRNDVTSGKKREKEAVETFSEWVKAIRSFIQIRIWQLIMSMSTKATHDCNILDKYVVAPADKAPNNIVRTITLILKDRIAFG
jgi:hypothetical protein